MENSFGKKVKKALQGAVLITGLSSAPESVAQSAKPYQAKDEKDYKHRMEMYNDSLRAYNESQKTKDILDAESHNEAFKLAGVSEKILIEHKKLWNLWLDNRDKASQFKDNPEIFKKYQEIIERLEKALSIVSDQKEKGRTNIERRFNLGNENWGDPEESFDPKIYTAFPEKNKPTLSDELPIRKTNLPISRGDAGFVKYPIYKKPRQKIVKPEKEQPSAVIETNEIEKTEDIETAPTETKPETYIMQDGRHYTYEDLIKHFPALKDAGVFERNFGKKPPHF